METKIISVSLTDSFRHYRESVKNIKHHGLIDSDSADWLLVLLDYDRHYDFVTEATDYLFSSDILTTRQKKNFAMSQLYKMKESGEITVREFFIISSKIDRIFI